MFMSTDGSECSELVLSAVVSIAYSVPRFPCATPGDLLAANKREELGCFPAEILPLVLYFSDGLGL
jgi:hypothetical protein